MIVADGTAEQVLHTDGGKALKHRRRHVTRRHGNCFISLGERSVLRARISSGVIEGNASLRAAFLCTGKLIKFTERVEKYFHQDLLSFRSNSRKIQFHFRVRHGRLQS